MPCNNLPPDNDIVGLDSALGDNFAKNVPMPIQANDGLIDRGVKLMWAVSEYRLNETIGVRVHITAVDSQNMPKAIFAYLLQPLVPGADSRTAAFDHVCSPSDLEEFPEDAPVPGSQSVWFRLNYVDLIVRSRTEAHIFIRELSEDVYLLKNTLDITDRIFPAGEITFGTIVASSSSSSSSSSS